jgi:deoxycytidine triphosphate deaminase
MKIDKNEIRTACITKQSELIDGFTAKLQTMEEDTTDNNISSSQTVDRSTEKIELTNAIGKELDFAKREMEFLKNLSVTSECKTVEAGAVVVTDSRTFYICVSIEDFTVNGQELFGMSTKAPLYLTMQGKKKGDTFSFNEKSYSIQDLY